MTRGERHAYEEHLTNVVILEDAIENAKWEGLTEGKAEGLAEGLAKGEAKALHQTAANMKRMGMHGADGRRDREAITLPHRPAFP